MAELEASAVNSVVNGVEFPRQRLEAAPQLHELEVLQKVIKLLNEYSKDRNYYRIELKPAKL